jgi:uncharacterized hydrophobic protein (TIGR00271 family)
MLHVRVISPAAVTARLTDGLTADPGVVNLVVIPAAAADPDGDAVQFDLLTSSANRVLGQLRELGLHRDSSVLIEAVDATMADPATHPAWDRRYHGERAPVWELMEARIREDAEYAPSFFLLLVLAGVIGACGILTNSQILIVGAMVVGPEYSAIISVALGLQQRDWRPVTRGLLVLLAGFVLAVIVTGVFALCIRWAGHTPSAYLRGIKPVSDLINSPNLYSVVVAVLAAIAGVVALALSRSGTLVGVFISVTTIPAAANVGVSAAFASWREAGSSVLQLLLNVGLLVIVGALALGAQRRLWRNWTPRSGRPPP